MISCFPLQKCSQKIIVWNFWVFISQNFAAMIPLNSNIYLILIFYPIYKALGLTLTYHTRLQLDLNFIFPTLRTLFTSSKESQHEVGEFLRDKTRNSSQNVMQTIVKLQTGIAEKLLSTRDLLSDFVIFINSEVNKENCVRSESHPARHSFQHVGENGRGG